MDLQADSVQGVLFVTPGQRQDDAAKLWEHLFPGDTPDGYQRANPATPSLASTASGEQTGLRITINAQVGRIDIIFNQPQLPIPGDGPLRIADVRTAAARMTSLMKSIVEHSRIIRVGLVLDLAKMVDQGQESTHLLSLLPGFPFPENATDVSVQFNSSRNFSCIPDIVMNRLCIWNSGHIGFIQTPAVNGMVIMKPFIGVKLDINTLPQARPPAEHLPAIIDEMFDESMEIYNKGFVRFRQ